MNDDFFNWGDSVTADAQEFVTLMPGKYTGKVTKIEKQRCESNGKMNGCPLAKITLEVEYDGGKAYVSDNIFLARNLEWKIAQFLHAFGLKEKGEPVRADRILDSMGKSCTITVFCQSGKDENYKTYTPEEVEYNLKHGIDVFCKIKSYEPLSETVNASASDDSEFGF
ncbi:DUF669 domain-containing protein [Faecalibaculum rodentium]|uniref:DUF669 domain-containing protein n=1 Tax=Faecalibaculum rodentium TaxID=1702221 RepID=UPI0025B22C3D|nr:DUF669 domain-containing protein [Faecalibaculum rodentium]